MTNVRSLPPPADGRLGHRRAFQEQRLSAHFRRVRTACEPIEELPTLHENPALVPHYLPGKHPAMNEMTERYNLPLEAVVGGPETMYPEYRKKIKEKYVMPPPCKEGCGGPPGGRSSCGAHLRWVAVAARRRRNHSRSDT